MVYQTPVPPRRLALPVQGVKYLLAVTLPNHPGVPDHRQLGNALTPAARRILRELFRLAIQNIRNDSLGIDLTFQRVQLRNV